MPAYQGVNTTQAGILIPRFKEGFLVTAGFPKTNASGSLESMQLPLRAEKSLFKWTTIKQLDVATGVNALFYQLAGNLIYVYSGVEFLQNLMLLSQEACQGFFSDLNGNHYNFVAEAGTYAAPTGTDLLSVGYKYSMQQMKQTTAEIDLKVILTENEWNLLNDPTFSATYAAGGSGGVSNGLVALAALAGTTKPGFKSITVNGISIGEINPSTDMIIMQGTVVPGNKGRDYARFAKTTLKAVTSQMNPTQVQGAIDHAKHADSYEVVGTTWEGVAWTFVTGMKPDISAQHGDEVGTLELNMECEFPYDFTNAIDFTSLTAPTFTQEGLY